jgi:hypothetical protein
MSAIVIRITPAGFTDVLVEADSRGDRRRLLVARDLLWPDLDRLSEQAARVMELCGDGGPAEAVAR